MSDDRARGLRLSPGRQYAVVTGAYWIFTLTDGALRTLVLLHLHELGFGALEIAGMFLAYEALGVLTNLFGGWLGARHGLKLPLGAGLALQALACAALAAAAAAPSLPLLFVAQGACGVSKDLVKASAKSYAKLVVPEGERGPLMRLVSLLTGSKNALKGVGFLLGALALSSVGFRGACTVMALALALALVASVALLPPAPGRRTGPRLHGFLSRDARLNWLSAARLFLFASRDAWFVVAVPLFLRAELSWSHGQVGAFLAAWTIGYGFVQAAAPRWVGREPDASHLLAHGAALLAPLAVLAVAFGSGLASGSLLVVGLAVFGVLFAANSALHSFLVVHYARADGVSQDVGVYYASNAAGRLVGTALSGALFGAFAAPRDGLVATLVAAAVLAAIALLLGLPLVRAERAHGSGPEGGKGARA